MTTVLVISRTSAIGMSLNLQGFSVEQWLQRVPGGDVPDGLDAALLDLAHDLQDPPRWVAHLRARHPGLPVVVLADAESCARLLPDVLDVVLAVPPISAADVAELVRAGVAARPASTDDRREAAPQVDGSTEVAAFDDVDSGPARDPVVVSPSTTRPSVPLFPADGDEQVQDLSQLPVPRPESRTVPTTPGRGRWRPGTSAVLQPEVRARRRRGRAGTQSDRDGWMAGAQATRNLDQIVAEVEERLTYVVPVTDLGNVLVQAAVADTDADSGVVLLRDEGEWIVVAGVGLRPLEYRARLHDDHWAVRSATTLGVVVRIEGTDVARQRLVGLPIAGSRNLLLAALGDKQALLAVGRTEPFVEQDVATLAELCGEALRHLRAALQLRLLARSLAGYDDLPPQSR